MNPAIARNRAAAWALAIGMAIWVALVALTPATIYVASGIAIAAFVILFAILVTTSASGGMPAPRDQGDSGDPLADRHGWAGGRVQTNDDLLNVHRAPGGGEFGAMDGEAGGDGGDSD